MKLLIRSGLNLVFAQHRRRMRYISDLAASEDSEDSNWGPMIAGTRCWHRPLRSLVYSYYWPVS